MIKNEDFSFRTQHAEHIRGHILICDLKFSSSVVIDEEQIHYSNLNQSKDDLIKKEKYRLKEEIMYSIYGNLEKKLKKLRSAVLYSLSDNLELCIEAESMFDELLEILQLRT